MLYRHLGKTGILVSEVSFGAHLDKANIANEERRAEQIMVAIENGINLFDIYDHSGYKQWEPMSRLLHPIRDEVLISLCTVWDSRKVSEEIDYALKVFKTDRIDLYRFVYHWMDEGKEENERRISSLIEAKRKGKVVAIGVAVHRPSETVDALRRYGEILDFIMAPLAYCFRKAISQEGGIAPKIRAYGLGLIAMKPLCGHGETGGSHLLSLTPPAEKVSILKAKGLSLGKAAIKALLQSDLVSTVMPTMNSVEEVLDNAGASGSGPLSKEEEFLLDLYWKELEKRGKGALGPQHWLWNWI
ncbi:MAG: aldo/keto reductase [Candidatus Bathyarchaeia archaeon]